MEKISKKLLEKLGVTGGENKIILQLLLRNKSKIEAETSQNILKIKEKTDKKILDLQIKIEEEKENFSKKSEEELEKILQKEIQNHLKYLGIETKTIEGKSESIEKTFEENSNIQENFQQNNYVGGYNNGN